jgi:hypothetical protein
MQRAVLAILLLNAGRVASSNRLINELWSDRCATNSGWMRR